MANRATGEKGEKENTIPVSAGSVPRAVLSIRLECLGTHPSSRFTKNEDCPMEVFSSISNEFGRWLQDHRWNRAARISYAVAVFFGRRSASAWYNRGLTAKFDALWADSLAFNRRATELDPGNMAAWWNLGIAATALGDWATARLAWVAYGIEVPAADGPIDMNLGTVPIRLSPESNAEVVWARRIDPARAQVLSVPLPDCGRGHQDMILHDGAPRGKRWLQGRELPVFNELQLLEPGGFATFGARLMVPTPADYAHLAEIASQRGAAVDDWSSLVPLCAKCSEGIPHEHEESAEVEWKVNRQVGVAARSEDDAHALIAEWLNLHSDRQLIQLDCVFSRT
jgi:hypothetical protein